MRASWVFPQRRPAATILNRAGSLRTRRWPGWGSRSGWMSASFSLACSGIDPEAPLHAKESGANVPFSSELSHRLNRRLSGVDERSRCTKIPGVEVFESRRIRIPAGTRMFLVENPLRQKIPFVKFPCRISFLPLCQVGRLDHTRHSRMRLPFAHAHPRRRYPPARANLQTQLSTATRSPRITKPKTLNRSCEIFSRAPRSAT